MGIKYCGKGKKLYNRILEQLKRQMMVGEIKPTEKLKVIAKNHSIIGYYPVSMGSNNDGMQYVIVTAAELLAKLESVCGRKRGC